LPVHLKTPDDPLREDKHQDIGDDLDTSGCKHHFREGVAFAG
jgi:hypothetical protein